MERLRASLLAAGAALLAACGDGGGTGGGGAQPDTKSLFGPEIDTIQLEVDYATGAEPYTGDVGSFGDLWGLFESNAEALFAGRGKTFVVPRTLGEMQAIGDVGPGPYDGDAILAIARDHRDAASGGGVATFYVIWLDGYYEENGAERRDVLGVSLGDTGVIAMFKPVIEGTALGPLDAIEKYVEQATLIHEFGHAVGLVDTGVPLASAHHDDEHPAHCTNQDCIMYFQVEGASGVVAFVQQWLTTGDTTLFGAECLGDTAALP